MSKISVVLPVYNVEPYLSRCIDSILGQTFEDFDLIIVESASTDKSGEICDSYAKKDKRITVIHEKERGGLSQGRNVGIEYALNSSTSDWITFIDSDDWVHKKYLEILVEIATNNNTDVSACGYVSVFKDAPDCLINEYKVEIGTYEELSQKCDYLEFNTTTAWAKLYKKSLFKDMRFPFGKSYEDLYVTYLVLFPLKKISVAKVTMYYYYQNHNSLSFSKLSVSRIKDNLDCYEEQMSFFYKNNARSLFQRAFTLYCRFINKHYKDPANDLQCAKELKNRQKNIRLLIRKYNDFLPDPLKAYGYKKWITEDYIKTETLKKDIRTIREERGLAFSLLWAIKQRIKGIK